MMNSTKIRWAGHVPGMEGMRNAYKVFVGKPERKRTTLKTWA
jgi:hypothetical protein